MNAIVSSEHFVLVHYSTVDRYSAHSNASISVPILLWYLMVEFARKYTNLPIIKKYTTIHDKHLVQGIHKGKISIYTRKRINEI